MGQFFTFLSPSFQAFDFIPALDNFFFFFTQGKVEKKKKMPRMNKRLNIYYSYKKLSLIFTSLPTWNSEGSICYCYFSHMSWMKCWVHISVWASGPPGSSGRGASWTQRINRFAHGSNACTFLGQKSSSELWKYKYGPSVSQRGANHAFPRLIEFILVFLILFTHKKEEEKIKECFGNKLML